MPTTENALYLLTTFDANGAETERLVSAASAHIARQHALRLNKASAADVARVLQAGGAVEEAKE